ncbi:hypothetical protein EDD37DRAFT_625133 [Exophiala viscosa]|uniref:uncharacterized protein n=1 Tax=Exophiala viscosa TaxID=2486360 RepID=UPI002198B232|nr:hypothetical protein EDD37DRAFT_625133 [Exophiala viscosa]
MPSHQSSKTDVSSKPKPIERPKLSRSQRERKRESDREAQRQIRQKTKNHIAHLEQLVKTLQESHADDARTNDLVEQIKSNRREMDSLRGFFRGVSKLVESVSGSQCAVDREYDKDRSAEPQLFSCLPEDGDASPGNMDDTQILGPSLKVASSRVSVRSSLDVLEKDNTDSQNTSTSTPPPAGFDLADLLLPECADNLGGQGWCQASRQGVTSSTSSDNQISQQTTVRRNISMVVTEILQTRSLEGRLYYLAGSVLRFILGLPREEPTPVEFTEDIAIRAVLSGWENVAEQYDLDPGWLWLRHLDEAVYSACGIPERLACLRIMRLYLQAQMWPQTSSSSELPAFLAPRPSQKFMEHDPLVEYFVWPGMREHMIFEPTRYATNIFMDTFRNQARFVWQHNPEDIFSRDVFSGTYSFSQEFIARQNDLRCWAVRSEFFVRFPELRQDIPCYDECLSLLPQLFVPQGQSSHIAHAASNDVNSERVVDKHGPSPPMLRDGLLSNYITDGL